MSLILYNGKIYTMDEQHPQVEAVLIQDGIIKARGVTQEILSLKNDKTELIDLAGKTVIPGLNDSHLHLYGFSMGLSMVNLMNIPSVEAMIVTVDQFIRTKNISMDGWVRGRGWNQDYFSGEKRFPTRNDLDKISTTNPIVLARACGHVVVVNSKALDVCGITANTPLVEGGTFDVESGLFTEKAIDLVYKQIPEPSLEELKNMLEEGMRYANSKGLTSLQTDDLNHLSTSNYTKMLQAYQELWAENRLTCRIYIQSLLPTLDLLESFIGTGYKTGLGDHFLKIGPLKILTDGSLGARTAAMTKPYHDDSSTKGILTFTNDELFPLIRTAHHADMQIAVHCIGDASMHQTFDIFEEVLNEYPREDHRHSIIHCQITDEPLLQRYKDLGIVALVQPIFLHYDLHIVEDRVGKEMASTSYAFKTMLNKGISVGLGTDCPVEPIDPMPNIYCAVTRQDLKQYPEGGWNPQECLTIEEAITAYTTTSAYASFEEDAKGKIVEGMLADLTVLDRDLFKIEPHDILNVEVDLTIVNGKVVYKR